MNKENVLKLAAHLRKKATAKKFDLGSWFFRNGQPYHLPEGPIGEAINECGTVACIAGHAAILAQPGHVLEWDGEVESIAKEWLAVSGALAEQLFVPPDVEFSRVTARIAANVLTHFAETGEIVWPRSVRGSD